MVRDNCLEEVISKHRSKRIIKKSHCFPYLSIPYLSIPAHCIAIFPSQYVNVCIVHTCVTEGCTFFQDNN